MKFSKTLLDNDEIRKRVFENGIDKANELLEYIFGADVCNSINEIINENDKEFYDDVSFIVDTDSNIMINKQTLIMQYGISFNYNNRDINFIYSICESDKDEDLLEEIINIREFNVKEEKIEIMNKKDFYKAIEEVENFLEERFDLNFTPLNLDIRDENIFDITIDEECNEWRVTFKQDDFEGEYISIFNLDDNSLKLIEIKDHKVYLD